MINIICKNKKTIENITDILCKNGIEYFLTHQYCFLDKIDLCKEESGIVLVFHLEYSDRKLKKVYKNKIMQILEGDLYGTNRNSKWKL